MITGLHFSAGKVRGLLQGRVAQEDLDRQADALLVAAATKRLAAG